MMSTTYLMQNNKVRILNIEILSDNWYTLSKVTFEYRKRDGTWETQSREAYDRGNGATILLYNRYKSSVILTKQFRMPTYINGNTSGLLIEACAGLVDQNSAEESIKKETEEETGYKITSVSKVYEAYMSPGSVTEIVYFFIAEYEDSMKISDGGGVQIEQEEIEVLEIKYSEAMQMIDTSQIKDAKTIMLLQYMKLKGIL